MSNTIFTSPAGRPWTAMPIGDAFFGGERAGLPATTGVVGPHHAWSPPN